MIKHIELSLRKCVAPEFVFGVDARKMAGKYAKNLGIKKVLIVTDPGVIRAGWVEDVTKALEAENIYSILFDDVVPNPRDTNVLAGVKLYREHKCDGIVTIGGGSPMDCAKGIGIVVANMGDVLAYEGVDKILYPLPPLICIPTTAGTAADVSQFAIINDIKRHVKIAIISKSIVPDVSLIDPETTMSMDKEELTINTGLDAMTHAVEAYVSNANSAITDLYALEAISLLAKNLPRVVEQPFDIQARASVMMASLLAGLAFSNASLGVIHAIAHSLGGWLDLPHGLCNAILLEHAVAYNFPHAKERYQTIASYKDMKGTPNCDEIVQDIREFKLSLGLTQRLGALGVTKEIIPHLASMALQDACIVTNPIMPSQHDVEEILIHAL
ncbi:iron-containing alcohol dehydrogenase [Sulfurospirillum diekertiae]|uniref:alcohol dehydrogenase-like regulatory protein ErcA n=1 Tax=Sulfurospirillum diekertiae TaxID=1854492 RepID=UPI0014278D3F|nr:alcohol dehydrogenase-like regulatory protein ErcA [Sulfurospirillum diekertiae]QIR79585.1 iron-containing alcohol dehydrogenase [Sulfurospirillum diekertiae]